LSAQESITLSAIETLGLLKVKSAVVQAGSRAKSRRGVGLDAESRHEIVRAIAEPRAHSVKSGVRSVKAWSW